MKKILLILIFCLGISGLSFSQATSQEDKEKEAERQRQADFNRRVDNLRTIEKKQIIRDRYKNTDTYREVVKPLYRELDQEEIALLSPDAEILDEYNEFLKQKGTGLVKLIIDEGCDKEPEIIASKPHCLKYDMPGAGSSYSFRVNSYRMKRLSDITFEDDKFISKGILTHGIFVNLGKTELNDLTLQSKGINVLAGFEPPEKMEQAKKLSYQLEKGIKGEKFLYASSVEVKENHTYALRSIAYKGNSYQTIKDVTYDEFEFDKRKDVIIVFKVIKVDDESVTILWKELLSEKSLSIK